MGDCEGLGLTAPTRSCPPGYFCPGGDPFPQLNCTLGHFCDGGNVVPEPCVAGTYSGMSGASSCDTCLARHICPASTSVPVDCPAGRYCAGGDVLGVGCPAGKFSNVTGL